MLTFLAGVPMPAAYPKVWTRAIESCGSLESHFGQKFLESRSHAHDLCEVPPSPWMNMMSAIGCGGSNTKESPFVSWKGLINGTMVDVESLMISVLVWSLPEMGDPKGLVAEPVESRPDCSISEPPLPVVKDMVLTTSASPLVDMADSVRLDCKVPGPGPPVEAEWLAASKLSPRLLLNFIFSSF